MQNDETPVKHSAEREPGLQGLGSKLYPALGELVRQLEMALRQLQEMKAPLSATSGQLPVASDHLADLARLTEEGTHTVMGLTEAIQENRASATALLGELIRDLSRAGCDEELLSRIRMIWCMLAEDEKRLLKIMTSLSFQDLVAQRVKALIAILEEVQHKLLEMMVIMFGLERASCETLADGQGNVLLERLEASRKTALKQDLVDDILGQFGLK